MKMNLIYNDYIIKQDVAYKSSIFTPGLPRSLAGARGLAMTTLSNSENAQQ